MSEGPKKVTAKDGHEYHKSSSANATTAPTNQATIDKAQSKGMDPVLLEFVTIIDYEWNLNGSIGIKEITENYGYTEDQYREYWTNDTVIAALEERGISISRVPISDTAAVGGPQAKLSPLQLIAANKMLDLTDNRSNRKKLQDLGITTTKYNAWLRDPEFTGYLQQRAESMLGDTQHEAMLALMDKVNARDLKAIEYYHEITGRFVRQNSTNQSGPDMQHILVRVIEIIIDEVDDVETAQRISERLKGLAVGAQVAGLTQPDTVVIPEIAKSREQTEQVKELMSKGMGYE